MSTKKHVKTGKSKKLHIFAGGGYSPGVDGAGGGGAPRPRGPAGCVDFTPKYHRLAENGVVMRYSIPPGVVKWLYVLT